jgi:hypothetical protein
MLRYKLSLTDILMGFENTLKIDYRDSEIEKIIKNSRQRLENAYGVKLSGDIYEDQVDTRLVGDKIDLLLSQILDKMKSLALIMSISLFDKRYGESLKDFNYMGFTEEELKTALKYLQDEVLYEKRRVFFYQIIKSTSIMEISNIKRLLVIMIVLEHLGIKEGVALIAQYLYLGIR